MELTNRIKLARGEKRLTQADMAEKLGITPSFYHKMESRGNKLSVEQIEKIADALDISHLELLTYGDENRNNDVDTELYGRRIEELESRVADKEEIIKVLRHKLINYEALTERIATFILNYLLNDKAEEMRVGKFHKHGLYLKNTGKTIDWKENHSYDEMRKKFPSYNLVLSKEEKRKLISEIFNTPSEKSRLAVYLLRNGVISNSEDSIIWIEEFNFAVQNEHNFQDDNFMPFEELLNTRFRSE